jgi:hypothetical protein
MTEKAKCSACGERDVFSKGLCSGCYGRQWRERRKAERASEPKLLTSGVTDAELEVIDGEIIHDGPPETHLVATSPVEMQAAQGDLKTWLEQRLTILERDIREANAALNEARRNGWATGALTSARNRAVDDETFYNKILIAVEAGHTIIPDFPIQVFAVRTDEKEREQTLVWRGHASRRDAEESVLGRQVQADCSPAGAGAYRNPQPELSTWHGGAKKDHTTGKEYFPFYARRSGRPAGPIVFPRVSGRSPVMKATAKAMAEKTFDQVGVCLPTTAVAGGRQVQRSTRAGDPLIIGQVLRKRQGGYQKAVSFIIAWHLNLSDL